jgi:YfiH family protein
VTRRDAVSDWLQHPLLASAGAAHGFGTRACRPPQRLLRPRQVHGTAVVTLKHADVASGATLGEADAVVSALPGVAIGVVTADCLPLLVAAPSGVVAAVHAGWRGLAAGVVSAALEALAALDPEAARAVAVIGPHVERGCYEVDAPVVDALARRFGADLEDAVSATRPGHWQLDLACLVRAELWAAGLARERVGGLPGACTACDAERFHSYRRDGPRAGRLVHWIEGTAGPGERAGSGLDTPGMPA